MIFLLESVKFVLSYDFFIDSGKMFRAEEIFFICFVGVASILGRDVV